MPGSSASDALAIFRAALHRVDPEPMVSSALHIEKTGGGAELVVQADGPRSPCHLPLMPGGRILAIAFGKAAGPMECGLESVLGPWLDAAIAVEPRDYKGKEPVRANILRGSHPLPDRSSCAAGFAVLNFVHSARLGPDDIVIVLISGGASALLCAPAAGLSPDDISRTTRLLLESGAAITEVNCVRKHLSAIKGGRLAAALAPAHVVSLILSDVMGDDAASIASGPTAPDPDTFADALAIVRRAGIEDRLPGAVIQHLTKAAAASGATAAQIGTAALASKTAGPADMADTPKPGSAIFNTVDNIIIGSNRIALEAGLKEARRLGYNSVLYSDRVTGEARDAALSYLKIAADIRSGSGSAARPACIVGGGETTVTIRGRGRGGRNQEMALAFLNAARAARTVASAAQPLGGPPLGGMDGLCFFSAGTDGIDGPTDAAGAVADADCLARAAGLGLDASAFLADNDSYHFFEKTGSLVKTGPTGTNVCDMQVLIVR